MADLGSSFFGQVDLSPSVSRDGAIIFGDLIGKLDALNIGCDKCGRKGRYAVARLFEKHGRDGKVVDFLAEIAADCPKKQARRMNDQCAVRCPDLAKVMLLPRATRSPRV